MTSVAIIGAGPAGLVAAKYMRQHGMDVTIFEQGDSVGGQWSGDRAYSGVWPAMHTNTNRLMTEFSDLPHRDDLPLYPANQQIHAYLQRYLERFGLGRCLRLGASVMRLGRDPGGRGWRLDLRDAGSGPTRSRVFDRVVIASGRYSKPRLPDIPGLDSFGGAGGVAHSFGYRGPDAYRRQRVLVAGGNISALEIAAELAASGAAAVISSQRRQRYVLSKLIAGVPVEHLLFTRFATLAAESLPTEAAVAGLESFIVKSCGSPEQFGALAPAGNALEAGITLNQSFLPLVAEGRIVARPWLSEIRGRKILFPDGSGDEVDALIFGTGFDLSLPFLDDESRSCLRLDDAHIDLFAHTLHPDLDGLAFLGLYDLVGPAFPVLELQARWLTYLWAGLRSPVPRAEIQAGLAAARAARQLPAGVPMHMLATLFARLAGVEPSAEEYPELAGVLLFGPLLPVSYRLTGPDRLPDAARRLQRAVALSRVVPDPGLTDEQRAQLEMLAGRDHARAAASA